MSFDPFHLQLLTISLDSQIVLAAVGIVVAGALFGRAASQGGLPVLGASDWFNLVFVALVGSRGVWLATHLDYYLRAPLQLAAFTDGGLTAVGLVLGMSYGIWRLRRGESAVSWRTIVDLAASATLIALTWERAGCALTSCGAGPPADLAWALQRSDVLRQPVALYQVAILAPAALLASERRWQVGQRFWITLAAVAATTVVGEQWGNQSALDELVAELLAGLLYTGVLLKAQRRAPGVAGHAANGVPAARDAGG